MKKQKLSYRVKYELLKIAIGLTFIYTFYGWAFYVMLERYFKLKKGVSNMFGRKALKERAQRAEERASFHITNIFRKLKVKNRQQAINRAKEIGYL